MDSDSAVAMATKVQVRVCDLCDDAVSGPGATFCFHCSELMCQSCSDKHKANQQFAAHFTIDVKDSDIGVLKCKDHPKRFYKMFCTECSSFVCQACLLNDHNNHSTVDIQKKLSNWENEFKLQLPQARNIKSEIDQQLSLVEGEETHQQRVYEHIVRRVYQHAQNLTRQIKEDKGKYLKTLSRKYKALKNSSDKTKVQLQSSRTEIKEALPEHEGRRLIDSLKDIRDGFDVNKAAESISNLSGNRSTSEAVCVGWSPSFIPSDTVSLGKLQLDKYEDFIEAGNIVERDIVTTGISMNVSEVTCEYTIPDFTDSEEEIFTTTFELQGIDWYLKIQRHKDEAYWSIYLYVCSNIAFGWSIDVDYTITLIGTNRENEEKKLSYTFSEDIGYGWTRFVSIDEMKKFVEEGIIKLRVCLKAAPLKGAEYLKPLPIPETESDNEGENDDYLT